MNYYVEETFNKIINLYHPYSAYQLIKEANCKLLYADLDDETEVVLKPIIVAIQLL